MVSNSITVRYVLHPAPISKYRPSDTYRYRIELNYREISTTVLTTSYPTHLHPSIISIFQAQQSSDACCCCGRGCCYLCNCCFPARSPPAPSRSTSCGSYVALLGSSCCCCCWGGISSLISRPSFTPPLLSCRVRRWRICTPRLREALSAASTGPLWGEAHKYASDVLDRRATEE